MIFLTILKQLKGTIKARPLNIWLLFLMIVSLIWVYIVESYNQSTMFTHIGDAFWWGIVTAATIGYGDKFPQTWLGQIFASIYIIISLWLFTQLLWNLLNFLFIKNTKKMNGTLETNYKNHIIIYSEKYDISKSMITQLQKEHDKSIVLITKDDQIPKEIVKLQSKGEQIHWISWAPDDLDVLKLTNIWKADKVILLSESEENSDKNLVTYIMSIRELNETIEIITEIKSEDSKFLFKKAWANVIINTNIISNNLLVRSSTDNVDVVIEEILSNDFWYEMFKANLKKEWIGKTFLDLKKAYVDSNVQIMSIFGKDNSVIFNKEHILTESDKVHILSEDRILEL